ncbi:MAG: aromatic amino acid lyase [Proteobacteria bacterium]|nr:aromatic amino acid lyase [Pseudomonadota bacterium]
MTDFTLKPGELGLADLRRLGDGVAKVTLDASCHAAIDAANATIARIVAGDARVYGVNTGVGSLAQTAISIDQINDMQRRLVLSHAAGTGPLLDDVTVRRILLLKANALAQGFSGLRRSLIDALLALYNADVLPCIPAQGSVGASGDLAPLAHLALTLLGEGAVRCGGETLSAAEGLSRAGLEPIEFGPKEALAMLNGTQVSTALALDGDTLAVLNRDEGATAAFSSVNIPFWSLFSREDFGF